jgi:hypothetical protein
MQRLLHRCQWVTRPRTVYPATEGQRLSCELSNRAGAVDRFAHLYMATSALGRLRDHVLRLGRMCAPLLLLLALPGCAGGPYWDEYASRTETMTFLTFVPCDKYYFFSSAGIPEHQTYFHAYYLSEFQNGSYWVGLREHDKTVGLPVYLLWAHYIGIQHYTALNLSQPPASEQNARCAEAVVLPWSEYSARPFYFPRPKVLRAAVRDQTLRACMWGGAAAFILCILWLCSLNGHLSDEKEAALVCTITFWVLVLINGAFLVGGLPRGEIDDLVAYFDFYDALPRSEGALLPLSWSQARQVFVGPPHPTALRPDFTIFYIVLFVSCALWIIVWAEAILTGIYLRCAPDPFEKLRLETAAEGRTPTPEEYLATLTAAAAGKSARKLEVLKRQAQLDHRKH